MNFWRDSMITEFGSVPMEMVRQESNVSLQI